MANAYVTLDTELTAIANAIRAKTGKSAQLEFPDDFVEEIGEIEDGTDVSDTTATASDVRSGKYFYNSSGVKTQGSIADKSSTDMSASGDTVSVPAGYYPNGGSKAVGSGSVVENAPTVDNDTGVVTGTATVTAGYVSADTKSNTLQLPTQAAQTIHPSTTDQEIAKGKFLTGKQTIKGVAVSGLSAENIKKNVTVKIGDSTDDDCVTSVTGTLEEGYTITNLFNDSGNTDKSANYLYIYVTIGAITGTVSNIDSATKTAIETAIKNSIAQINSTIKNDTPFCISRLYAWLYMAIAEYNNLVHIRDIFGNIAGESTYSRDKFTITSGRFQINGSSAITITWYD